MIKMSTKGDYSKANSFFEKLKEGINRSTLDKYGKMGVEALKAWTPKDTGVTAESWHYTIDHNKNSSTITWYNTNMAGDAGRYQVTVAVLLQYGHATKNGGWVQGVDYINPAMKPIFEDLADKAWKEMTKA